ncbi:SDR family oxidoreductase [Temperatibacter marinus]|uniref:SDR family oxidoreductase n=1 Tax=Temperatibacter marinus TaxID=1456591 RepID=A0AA52HA31_9PROT|nr:SDR family oxidoreductase [Temperatibacter marinus]WND02300.1 SDR family oxidoreductase [Temperatibacter marinus]
MTVLHSGKTFLVTGASRGIGAATASCLLNQGATVIGSYSTKPGALESFSQEYGRDRILAVQADLTSPCSAFTLFQSALAFSPYLDGIVNNAGIMSETPLTAETSQWHSDWQQTMQVNVQAVADLCKQTVQYLQERQTPGHIINIASRAAFRGDGPDYWHYAASKGAVIALTRTIARAYAAEDIYAFSISPGWVKTDMAAVAYEPGNEHMLEEIPLGRAAEPIEIAEMISFLLSGKCNSSTGSNFDINGASYVR